MTRSGELLWLVNISLLRRAASLYYLFGIFMVLYIVEWLFLFSPTGDEIIVTLNIFICYIVYGCVFVCEWCAFTFPRVGLFRGSAAQTASGDFVVRALGTFHLEREPRIGARDPGGSNFW